MTKLPDSILLILVFLLPAAFMNCDGTLRGGLQELDSVYINYQKDKVPYTFFEPDTIYILDEVLNEASALTALPDGNLATVEDENGIVFILNNRGEIVSELEFGDDGDFEGIEYLDGYIYVIESNGDVTRVDPDNPGESEDASETEFDNGNDVEGLGIIDGDLLIACKGSGDAGSFEADGKGVYRVDPETLEIKELVIEVEEDQLEEVLRRRIPEIDVNDFDPSAVAVNPVDGNIYLLSADMLIAVFSGKGELLEVIPLLARMYRQPEGIAFMPDGTLYIVSEASGGEPQLFRFTPK